MRAAVYYGPNKLEVGDVPEPTPAPGTVKVKVGFNGICGTDLHGAARRNQDEGPRRPVRRNGLTCPDRSHGLIDGGMVYR